MMLKIDAGRYVNTEHIASLTITRDDDTHRAEIEMDNGAVYVWRTCKTRQDAEDELERLARQLRLMAS